MATINSYPNNADEYIGAEEVMHWHHGRTSGVFGADSNLAVSAVSGQMAVEVSDGLAWMTDSKGNGIACWNDEEAKTSSPIQLTIEPAENTGTLSRIDRIIIEWTIGQYENKPEIKVLKGTDSSSPVAPSLTNNLTVRQISLARILIPAASTEITNINITDERTDASVCGIVTETVNADTSMIQGQYEDALAELRSAIEQAWSGEISEGAVSMVYTGTIPTGWSSTGGSAPYTKAVSIPGILATDSPIVDLQASSTYTDAEEQISAWGMVYRVVATANTLTFYATDEPEVAIPVKVRCIRK